MAWFSGIGMASGNSSTFREKRIGRGHGKSRTTWWVSPSARRQWRHEWGVQRVTILWRGSGPARGPARGLGMASCPEPYSTEGGSPQQPNGCAAEPARFSGENYLPRKRRAAPPHRARRIPAARGVRVERVNELLTAVVAAATVRGREWSRPARTAGAGALATTSRPGPGSAEPPSRVQEPGAARAWRGWSWRKPQLASPEAE